MENNQIQLLGKVERTFFHEYSIYGEDFYSLIISVTRTSGVTDTLRLLCSGKNISSTDDITGKYVEVFGNIRTRNENGHLLLSVFVESLNVLEANPSESDYNKVYLEGYICKRQADCRTTPFSDRTITDIILAVNRNFGKSSYIPCITWNRNAVFTSSLPIGTKVRITGRLQSRTYTKADGFSHTVYEVSVQQIEVAKESVA